jgi:hypothetical protein
VLLPEQKKSGYLPALQQSSERKESIMKATSYLSGGKHTRTFCHTAVYLAVLCVFLCMTAYRAFADKRKGFTIGIGGGAGGALLLTGDSGGSDDLSMLPYFSIPIQIRCGFGINDQLNISFLEEIAPTDFEVIMEGYEWFFGLGEWLAIAWPIFPFIGIVGSQIFAGPELTWYLESDTPSWFVSGAIGFYVFLTKAMADNSNSDLPGIGGLGARFGIGYEYKPHVSVLFTLTSLLITHPNAPPGYVISCGLTFNLTAY